MLERKHPENTMFDCKCRAEEIVFLPCSGASNCGQIASQVALKLDEEGKGRMYCLAGMVKSAREAKRIVALDGCDTTCARHTIEHARVAVTDWGCITKEGIINNHQFQLDEKETELIAQRVKESLAKPVGGTE